MKILLRAIVFLDDDSEVKILEHCILEIADKHRGRTCLHVGKHSGEKPDLVLSRYVLLPRHLNAHVHVLDLDLRHYFHTYYIDDVVGAPFGIKYLHIRNMQREEAERSIYLSLSHMYYTGTGASWIVLENGLRYCDLVELCSKRASVNVQLFVEPSVFHLTQEEDFDERIIGEVRDIVRLGYNVELVSPLNYLPDELSEIRKIARLSSRKIMTHVSETYDTHQEGDLRLAIDVLDADILVHCCYISDTEVELLENRILVITPRSNLKLAGRIAPVRDILRLGDRLGGLLVGTDNVGLHDPNMWDEYKTLARVLDRDTLRTLFLKVIETTYNVANSDKCNLILNGQLVSLEDYSKDTLESIMRGEVHTVGVLVDGQPILFKQGF